MNQSPNKPRKAVPRTNRAKLVRARYVELRDIMNDDAIWLVISAEFPGLTNSAYHNALRKEDKPGPRPKRSLRAVCKELVRKWTTARNLTRHDCIYQLQSALDKTRKTDKS